MMDTISYAYAASKDVKNINGFIKNNKGEDLVSTLIPVHPTILDQNHTLPVGYSAVVASGFTVADGVTLTIPDGSILSVV